MSRPHALVVPYPAQGHVIPMMELALCLANSGIRVTFVNTKSNHDRVLKALPPAEHLNELISFVSVSDGLESWEDRMDFAKSIEAMSRVVPGELDGLIESINSLNDNAVTCIITDVYMAWLTRVDEKFRLKRAAFHAGAVALLAITSSVEKLADDGVIDGEGLELTNRPFLWVVRQDITGVVDKVFPEGFEERVTNRGKMVEWAPQQEVLAHPSVGCFVSHCGWNSTIESVSSGVPILCWPYFADQFLNRSYIVDHWRVGLSLEKDEADIIRNGEIKTKVEQILTDEGFKTRALKLQQKTKASATRGSSQRNLENFMDWIKEN